MMKSKFLSKKGVKAVGTAVSEREKKDSKQTRTHMCDVSPVFTLGWVEP